MKNIKDLLVDYTANKIRRREVSVQDIMELMNREFPEFLSQITAAYYQAGYDDASKTMKVASMEEKQFSNKKNKKRREFDERELY